ncbi:MAG: RNA pseudouridine synthase, partial [Candidatus Methanofastidiosa archaeon]|nr:RNA pseudouridine synthase [Candidatus Methanofastidiosa archaeon]
MEPRVIYEDESFFVVDKPTGWITNDSDTVTNQPVLQKWIRENFQYHLNGNKEMRDGIVHRLDKETSGIVLVAKTQQSFERLQSEFKNREVHKTYIALLHGKIDPEEGTIEVTVGRLPWRRDRFGVVPDGRSSLSNYKLQKFYPANNG